jgi:hypothetical protein
MLYPTELLAQPIANKLFTVLHFFIVLTIRYCKHEKARSGSGSPWQKTQYANLVRYKTSETYFTRIRIGGKLIWRSLKTKVLSVALLGSLTRADSLPILHLMQLRLGLLGFSF